MGSPVVATWIGERLSARIYRRRSAPDIAATGIVGVSGIGGESGGVLSVDPHKRL